MTKTRTHLPFFSFFAPTMARTPSLTGVLHVNHEILLIVATIVILGVVILALVVASKRGAKVLQDPENQVNQNQGEILQELVPRAEVVSRDQDLHRLMVWVNDLKCSLATQQELLDDLSNPQTFITALDTPAVKNQVLVGFAENFFPGVIINNDKVVALPEGEPCQRFRSVLCEGSQEGTQCGHCRSLSHFISTKKYDYFNKGNLGPSPRTLRKYGPVVDPYGSLAREKVDKVVIGLLKGQRKEKEGGKRRGDGKIMFTWWGLYLPSSLTFFSNIGSQPRHKPFPTKK